MTLKEICALVDGKVVCGEERLEKEAGYACASDLMSDVLTLKTMNFIVITGLANIQSVRTAEMSDARAILLCRGKNADENMLRLAGEANIMIIESRFSVFKCAGLLYEAGIKPIY